MRLDGLECIILPWEATQINYPFPTNASTERVTSVRAEQGAISECPLSPIGGFTPTQIRAYVYFLKSIHCDGPPVVSLCALTVQISWVRISFRSHFRWLSGPTARVLTKSFRPRSGTPLDIPKEGRVRQRKEISKVRQKNIHTHR